MNKRMILYIQGAILLIEAAIMVPADCGGAHLPRDRPASGFSIRRWRRRSCGFAAMKLCKAAQQDDLRQGGPDCRGGWAGSCCRLVGALPFTLSGEIPFYLDAVFEMISGFTTTGSSILPNVEALSRCMLLWRSFSHWLGGMGILVFMLAIVKMEGGQGIHLLRAESPGPTVGKMVPRMVDSSKILYTIYFALTLVQVVFYLAGGMPLFDSLCNAFATAGTGGFSIKADSFAGYSAVCADGHNGVHGAVRRELLDLLLPAAEEVRPRVQKYRAPLVRGHYPFLHRDHHGEHSADVPGASTRRSTTRRSPSRRSSRRPASARKTLTSGQSFRA